MASSSLARPMAREMASFIAATWRLMVCPTEATDCSASRSGSASRTATSVMAEAMRRSSCARQTRSARNQKMTIGTRTATAAVSAEALPSRPESPAEADLGRDQAEGEKAADEEPGHRGDERHQEGRARRPLLEGEDQPADRWNVVIGGGGKTALRRRARRATRADELAGRWRGALARRLGELRRRLRRRFLLRRLLAFWLTRLPSSARRLRACAARP